MSTRRTPTRSSVAQCPICATQITLAGSRARQKVQCPKCRQIIELEKAAPEEAPAAAEPGRSTPTVIIPAEPAILGANDDRVAALERRIVELERTLAQLVAAPPAPEAGRKVKWIAGETLPDYSPVQADVLGHNLRTIRSHAIRIQFPCGDQTARTRAEWFGDIFSRAEWRVRGPEDTQPGRITASGLALATCLPVSPEAAATYLAIRAAGFPLATVYDQNLRASEERLIVA
ncbi:MAG: hypothetical protein ACO1QR_07210 [Chthoniobacteraceae bacterium]